MHEIVVVSDFHLGRGKNPATGRFYELEAFFYDDDFRSFCQWLVDDAARRDAQVRLVLNGDTFDLLRIDRPPHSPEATLVERQFGPFLTPDRATRDIIEILEGHPLFVEGLARVLAVGHEIVMLPGNHDLEMQWPCVHDEVRKAILERVKALGQRSRVRDLDDCAARLHFPPWFWYEPDRIWIEHGCQYDPENAFIYMLRPGLAAAPRAIHEAEYDMPLGNFFQRYLFNGFGAITFIVPSTRAHLRYFKWLIANTPHLLTRVIFSHMRFWPQVIRRISHSQREAKAFYREQHERTLAELAERSGLGDKLLDIDGFKERGASVVEAVTTLTRQGLRAVLVALVLAAVVFGLWFAGFHAIDELKSGFLLKSLLFLMLDFGFLLILIVAIGWLIFRDPAEPSSAQRQAAQRIVKKLDVPIVTFGHMHDEVIWRLQRPNGGAGWYYNTGTWLAVFTHDVLLPRERVQFTFLRVQGKDAELLHWSPGRQSPAPVILLDERHPMAEPRRQAGAELR